MQCMYLKGISALLLCVCGGLIQAERRICCIGCPYKKARQPHNLIGCDGAP